MTFYQWIFCCAVNPSKEHKPRNKTSKRIFISRNLAELMKSGRFIIKCPPFISWEACGCSWHQKNTSCKKQLKPVSGFMIPCRNRSCNRNMARTQYERILTYVVESTSSCKKNGFMVFLRKYRHCAQIILRDFRSVQWKRNLRV